MKTKSQKINQPLDNNKHYNLSARPLSLIETALKRLLKIQNNLRMRANENRRPYPNIVQVERHSCN